MESFDFIQRKGHKIILYRNRHGICFRFYSSCEDAKRIFRWFEGLSEVKIQKNYYFEKYQSQETESCIFLNSFIRALMWQSLGDFDFPSCTPIRGIYRKSLLNICTIEIELLHCLTNDNNRTTVVRKTMNQHCLELKYTFWTHKKLIVSDVRRWAPG